MTRALIVASRGAGLTTFVGLLYMAQVRLATEEGSRFRFHAEHATLRQLDHLYADLGAGRFPTRDESWDEHPLSFTFEFGPGRSVGSGRLGRWFGGRGGRVEIGGITTEELAELARNDHVLADVTGDLLRSPVVIALVDASRFRPIPPGAAAPAPPVDDPLLAASLALLARYLSTEPDRRARTMHPIFVLTKLDRCPKEARDRLEGPTGTIDAVPGTEREGFGRRTLEQYLPATGRWLAEAGTDSPVPVGPVAWYFSSVRPREGGAESTIALRSRLPAGGWEPVYPYAEYRALIEQLGRLSERLPEDSDARERGY